jgi:predicted ATPase/DNA-binding SARP family transcriptional activator
VVGFRSDKVRALLAYLAAEHRRPWPRSQLAGLLWPDLGEKEAHNNLRNAISNLRTLLGDQQRARPFLLINGDTLQFNTQADCWMDVKAFLELSASEPNDIENLEKSLELFQGDFLEGFFVDSAPFEEWQLLTSQHMRSKVLEVLHLLVLYYDRSAKPDQALRYARRWVELEPLDEHAQQSLLRMLWGKGQRNAALAHFEAYRGQLLSELGVEPAPETLKLYEQIRGGQVQANLNQTTYPDEPAFLLSVQRIQAERTFFAARQKELEHLDRKLVLAAKGQGQIVLVTGDPGSGKTTLMAEFVRRALARIPDLLAVQSQCSAYTGESDPFFPFLEILQILCGDLEARAATGALNKEQALRLWRFLPTVFKALLNDGPDLINRFVPGQNLLAAARSHPHVKPELLARLQELADRTLHQAKASKSQQAALFSQITRVLSSISRQRPLLLVLDDLQWIDTDSANMLFHLGRHLAGHRILLVGGYRPENLLLGRKGDRHPLEGVVHELQAALGDIQIDLMQSEGMDFIEAVIDSEPNRLTPLFRQQLHRHTGGHALFTIELLRGMQLRGDLYRSEQGKWEAHRQLDWDTLPARVEAVIAERIRHLPPASQALLRLGSVEGDVFTAEVLAGVSGIKEQDVIETLSQETGKRHRLVAVHNQKQAGGRIFSQYRFRHFLYQKYLYQQLDAAEKHYLHHQIGSALESFFGQDLRRYPEISHQLARHFHLAGVAEKAVHYYTESGRYALQLSAYREAVAHFEQALELCQCLPVSASRDETELKLRLGLGPLLTAARGWAAPELEENYRQAAGLCEKLGDSVQLVPALWLLAVYHLGCAQHNTVDALVSRLYRLAQNIGDEDLLCLASLQVSPLYQGRLAEAYQILYRLTAMQDVEQQRRLAVQYGMSPGVVGQAYLAHCMWLLGDPEQAWAHMRQSVSMAAAVNHPMTTCYAAAREIWQHAFSGKIEPIPSLAGELLQVAQQHELQGFELAARFFTAWASSQAGSGDPSLFETMEGAMQEYKGMGTLMNRTTFLNLLAQACLTNGRLERGLAATEESICVGEQTGERWFEAEALRIKGELLICQGDLLKAEVSFQAARETAIRQGARLLEMRAESRLDRLREG